MKKTILVTGAGGIVGRATVEVLTDAGANVIPLVHKIYPGTPKGAIPLDLTAEPEQLSKALQCKPDAVVHLAAAIPHSVNYPDNTSTAELTRRIDATIFAKIKEWDVQLLYASGCSLYDPSDPGIKDESSALKVNSPYLLAKLEAEQFLSSVPSACIMRISGPYGPGLRKGVVLARFIETARADKDISIWGSGYREQDFISASDTARFIKLAIEKEITGIFNVCSGVPTKMIELAEAVIEIIGKGKIVMSDIQDPQEGTTSRYSNIKVRRELGWEPFIDLHTGIKSLINERFVM